MTPEEHVTKLDQAIKNFNAVSFSEVEEALEDVDKLITKLEETVQNLEKRVGTLEALVEMGFD